MEKAKLLCLIETDDRNYYFRKALDRLSSEYPGEITGECFSTGEVRMKKEKYASLMEAADTCDFAVLYFHGGCANLPDFPGFWKRIISHAPCFMVSTMTEEISELMPESGLEPEEYRTLDDYFSRPCEENCYQMLLRIANRFGAGQTAELYQEIPSAGIYLDGRILDTAEEAAYLKEARTSELPVVGVLIHRNSVQSGNLKGVDALKAELIRQGAFPLIVFSSISPESDKEETGAGYALEKYFRPDGKVLVSCILAATGFSISHASYPEGTERDFRSSIFEKWNVPVIHASSTRLNKEQYASGPQGIDGMSLGSQVFQPEMDGQVISVPFVLNEETECEGISRRMWEPEGERIAHLVRLAVKFSALSRKENRDKKVAILFHNVPGNHNIGRGSGLDTFASVRKLLVRMKEEGYLLDTVYENPQDLADSMLRALTNDLRWISGTEALKRSADLVTLEEMEAWFDRLAEKNREQLEEFWGTFPGNVMIEEEKLLIPGIINGNLFIGLQPSRAFDDQADRLYHDAVFPPPYSYIGYYRWIEEVFQADAIIHVGTHGTVEWLPGKETGLSSSCYPDICLGTLPNFYIYHMGILGEGTQAKRRSAAVILDHLPPSMDDAGVYDRLADLDEAMKEYMAAKQAKTGQVPVLQQRIFKLAEEANLTTDLKLTRESYDAAAEESIEKLHLWMEDLKNSVVTDGLHIFGEAPQEGKLYENMMRMLVRVRNGKVAALNDGVLSAEGYDAEQIKESPGRIIDGRPASVIYEEAVEKAKELLHTLAESGYAEETVEELVQAAHFPAGGNRIPLKETLKYLCETVRPALDHTKDEIENMITGLSGGFVEPGHGGNPTRGNVALLPSGRNFHSGDPSEIPSVGAWEIGQKLAARSLEHYMKERGEYPESIAIVIWSGNVIKSSGEDFGEIFALMGVRPVYLGNTSQVIGVEAIPLTELGRPRIDVTLRISGLFRDMYPNLIELMDAAVSCVADLDESEEQNYIRKHIHEDMLKLLEEGLDENTALDQAYVRVYGCPAGGYGTGIAELITTKNWKDYKDLANVYETWSGNGYGRGYHGKGMQKMFRRRLASVGMTIKNEITVEIDMLSCDDHFSYHGGLVACVKANTGKIPISLTGHSDDPDKPYVRDTARETARIIRSRMLNPKWLEGLMRHGFKGAQEISKTMDYFFGWDATAEVGEDWMYEQIAQNFLFDAKTREWIEQVNAGVVYDVAEKLLEAEQRGMWKADEETRKQVQNIFLRTEGMLEDGKV